MAVDDQTRLQRKYGCSAIYLRRLLHESIPETRTLDSNIISLMEECGAAKPGDLDKGTLSKWLSGRGPCDSGRIRTLLERKSELDANTIAEHIQALDYMQMHAQALPDTIALPNVPARVCNFLDAVPERSVATVDAGQGEILPSGSTIVEDLTVNTGTVGEVKAERGAEAEVSNVTAPHFEMGDITAESGAVARVRNLKVGESFTIGRIHAGIKPGKS